MFMFRRQRPPRSSHRTDETHADNVEAVRQGIVDGQVTRSTSRNTGRAKSTTPTPFFNA